MKQSPVCHHLGNGGFHGRAMCGGSGSSDLVSKLWLEALDKEHPHVLRALDGLQAVVGQLEEGLDELPGVFRDDDFVGLAVGFHAAGYVHGVAEDVVRVGRRGLADYSRGERPGASRRAAPSSSADASSPATSGSC